MPSRSGTTYLLDKSDEPNPTPMDSQQLSTVLAALQAKLNDITLTLHQTNEKIDKVIAHRESSIIGENSTPPQNNSCDNTDKTHLISMINF